jgi:hypothetical protein
VSYPQYPSGYGFPAPPPKKSYAGVLAASLATVLTLGGGFYAYNHFLAKDDPGSTMSSSGDSFVVGAHDLATAAPPSSESAPGMFSSAQTEYLERLQESGINANSPGLVVRDGQDVCTSLSRGGSFTEAVQLMLQKNNSGINESGAMFATVTAVQTLCPQDSPFVASSGTPIQPTPPGQDGEFIRRLQGVGLSVANYDDAIADGRGVCAAMSDSPSPEKFLGAVQAVDDANPRAGKNASIFLSVTAMQVYCQPR